MRLHFFNSLLVTGLLACGIHGHAQNKYYGENVLPPSTVESSNKFNWVDSVYNTLSLEEKIGQLFMIAAYSGGENYNETAILQLIKKYHIGGLIFMQGTAQKQAALTNKYQKLSKVPLLIGMDAEWGLGMRLTGIKNLPRQMMLGATGQPELMYKMGQIVSKQCQLLGVHINFAPTIDINNNPDNPVINFRSFGEDKQLVTTLGMAYMKGLQDNNVIACAKHFPGHGDVDVDSHLELPLISKSKQSLDTMELYPFRNLIQAGVSSIMIAHLSVPSLDSCENLPATLSQDIVSGLLRNELGFGGLVITDALNMKGVTKYYKPGEVDVKAFMAGNDILLFSEDVPTAVKEIKKTIENGQISQARLEYSVKRILMAKYNAGLNDYKELKLENLDEKINAQTSEFFEQASKMSITLLRDQNTLIQKLQLPSSKIAYYNPLMKQNDFFALLQQSFSGIQPINDVNEIDDYDVVILGLHGLSLYAGQNRNYNITEEVQSILNKLSSKNNILNVVFGNAYAANFLCQHSSVLVTYEENEWTYKTALDVLAGRLIPQGKLPVSVCQNN